MTRRKKTKWVVWGCVLETFEYTDFDWDARTGAVRNVIRKEEYRSPPRRLASCKTHDQAVAKVVQFKLTRDDLVNFEIKRWRHVPAGG